MNRAKQQMQVKLFQSSNHIWQVKPSSIAARVENNLFVRPTRRNGRGGYVTIEEHRQLRLDITSELLGRETPLTSYYDLSPDECRALAMFLADMPLDIIDEVWQEYSDRAFKMIDYKLKAYA